MKLCPLCFQAVADSFRRGCITETRCNPLDRTQIGQSKNGWMDRAASGYALDKESLWTKSQDYPYHESFQDGYHIPTQCHLNTRSNDSFALLHVFYLALPNESDRLRIGTQIDQASGNRPRQAPWSTDFCT